MQDVDRMPHPALIPGSPAQPPPSALRCKRGTAPPSPASAAPSRFARPIPQRPAGPAAPQPRAPPSIPRGAAHATGPVTVPALRHARQPPLNSPTRRVSQRTTPAQRDIRQSPRRTHPAVGPRIVAGYGSSGHHRPPAPQPQNQGQRRRPPPLSRCRSDIPRTRV